MPVLCQETVRIMLMVISINDLKIQSGDFLNAHILSPVIENVWSTLVPEFDNDASKTAVIVRVLYGLKSVGAFRSNTARHIESIGYGSCKADQDLWLKPEIKPEDEVQFYSYLLCYVDDILCIHYNAESFALKLGFGKPNM